jgi:hypothetical protein
LINGHATVMTTRSTMQACPEGQHGAAIVLKSKFQQTDDRGVPKGPYTQPDPGRVQGLILHSDSVVEKKFCESRAPLRSAYPSKEGGQAASFC